MIVLTFSFSGFALVSTQCEPPTCHRPVGEADGDQRGPADGPEVHAGAAAPHPAGLQCHPGEANQRT